MSRTRPLSEVKAKLSEIIDEITTAKERVIQVISIDHRADIYRPR
ncbi:MAG: hypothetical protein M5U23_07675 [Acidimicrobiia bacterium]|nr:hypothetical protein [Acidimicrobiia bacterium]